MSSVVPPPVPPVAPALSIVVASFRAAAVLEACLASLLPQASAIGAEVVIARAPDAHDLDALAAAYPGARVVAAATGADLPRVRGAGLAAATGRLVALTEDHCVPAPGWAAALLAHSAHGDDRASRVDAVGGAMDNARTARAVDWGAFFSEYGFFTAAGPTADGVPLLTGANVAYARHVVGDVAAWALDGAWENVIHARLAARGAVLRFDPTARVRQNLTYAFVPFCVDRYVHGRDFARVRSAPGTRGAVRRWVHAASAPLLPPLLTWRVGRRIGRGGQSLAAFARALPYTFAFLAAWSAGELVGYVRGPER